MRPIKQPGNSMRHHRRTIFIRLAARTILLGMLCATSAPALAQEPSAHRLDVLVSGKFQASGPGLSVAVYRAGTIVYRKAVGFADLDHHVPLATRSVFDIASMSKQFTAMAVVLLQEDGKLSLDDRITKYIPELSPVADGITIRQLLNHTSGIRDYLDVMGLAGDQPENRIVSQSDVLTVVTRERHLNFAPGDRFLYDNSSYALMATLVERVSGKSLAEFANTRIFGPLGMTSTHFYSDHRSVIPNRAFGYEPKEKGWNFLVPLSDEIGDGGVWTTVEDLARWDANFYHPKIGGSEGVTMLQTPGRLNDGAETGYALGLFIQNYHGLQMVSHGGVDPGYRAQMLRFPTRELTVCVLANNPYYDVEGLARQIADLYLGPTKREVSDFGTPATASIGTPYLGKYLDRAAGRLREFVIQDGRFALRSGGKNFPLNTTGPSHFVNPSDGTRIDFARSAGNAVEMTLTSPGGTASHSSKITMVDLVTNPGQYVGAYMSPELGATWRITMTGSSLGVSAPANNGVLTPLDIDDFSFDGMLIHFVRDGDDAISGFDLTNIRDTNFAFERARNP